MSKFKNDEIISIIEKYFANNSERFGIETVFLFGSRVSGYPREDSDVDIGVVFQEEALSDETIFSIINDISFDLIQTLNITVDVVPVYKDFRKPIFYYNIIVFGKPVYIRDFNKYIRIKNDALFYKEDFSLFGEKWQYIVSKQRLGELNNA